MNRRKATVKIRRDPQLRIQAIIRNIIFNNGNLPIKNIMVKGQKKETTVFVFIISIKYS